MENVIASADLKLLALSWAALTVRPWCIPTVGVSRLDDAIMHFSNELSSQRAADRQKSRITFLLSGIVFMYQTRYSSAWSGCTHVVIHPLPLLTP